MLFKNFNLIYKHTLIDFLSTTKQFYQIFKFLIVFIRFSLNLMALCSAEVQSLGE